MIDGGKVLAVVPARGGSKGVPRKNIRMIGGKPLIGWTIDAARASRYIDRVILSSDDAEIAMVARGLGCEVPFVRDAALAGDAAPTIDVVVDALHRCPGHAWVVLLQPTSPLRSAEDIDETIDCCMRTKAPACVSVALAQESPYWMYTIGDNGAMRPLLAGTSATRRQDLPAVYSLNGAVYVARTEWLLSERTFLHEHTVAHIMPAERSLDIDTEFDIAQLEMILRK